jgi:hypothetical protein
VAAQFETGFFSTPSDLKTAADELNAEINNIDALSSGDLSVNVQQDTWDGFQVFLSQWKHFYSSNFGSLTSVTTSWLTTDLQAQLLSFQGQAQQWGQQIQEQTGGEVPGGIIDPADNSLPSVLPKLPVSWGLALVIVLAIVVAWKVL